jgi:hypothetical protein
MIFLAIVLAIASVCQAAQSTKLQLSEADRAAIVKFTLEHSLVREKYDQLPASKTVPARTQVVLSMKNIELKKVAAPPGFEILFLSPKEIQYKANREHRDFLYVQFSEMKEEQGKVTVQVCDIWADGTSTVDSLSFHNLGQGCSTFVFTKESGAWVGKSIGGWIA